MIADADDGRISAKHCHQRVFISNRCAMRYGNGIGLKSISYRYFPNCVMLVFCSEQHDL